MRRAGQVVGQSAGRYRVMLYDSERRSVAQRLAEADLVSLDLQVSDILPLIAGHPDEPLAPTPSSKLPAL